MSRGVICSILRHGGYTVLESEDARQALEICRRHAEGIGALVADVLLPRGSGVELAYWAIGVCSDLRVLLTSGAPMDFWPESDLGWLRGMAPQSYSFLPKPFTCDRFIRSFHALLNRPRATAAAGNG
jgi:DNA-binding NtrC family response regulator